MRFVGGPTASVKATARWMTVSPWPGTASTDLPSNFAAPLRPFSATSAATASWSMISWRSFMR